jgi:quinol monooxygenase YgiN
MKEECAMRVSRNRVRLVSSAGAGIALMSTAWVLAQQSDETKPEQPRPAARGELFPNLIESIKGTKGCLGVEAARTMSGKNVIFAWFEDKEAVKAWYYSEYHQQMMKQFFPDAGATPPLRDVPDDVGPIMAIASITMADKPKYEGLTLPISQISIELYTPVTGGIFLGSRFAPEALKVDNMQDFTPKEAAEGDE